MEQQKSLEHVEVLLEFQEKSLEHVEVLLKTYIYLSFIFNEGEQ
jgi:hypothetical protein